MKDNRTYADRREYMILAVAKRRKALRQKSLDYKGGKCSLCGYSKCPNTLEFHHERDKAFGLSESGNTRSWTKIQPELDKCI